MKVGILTFHRALNHGAVLQALALSKILADMGYESAIIDYCPIRMLEQYKVNLFKKNISFKKTVSNIVKYIPRRIQYNKFDLFRQKYFNTTSILITEEAALRKYNENFDAYICGSDQVWNPAMYNDTINPIYFLDFISSEQAIKISYAASFGNYNIEHRFYSKMKKYLEDIKYLSVREEDGVKLIQEICGRNSQQVVDPVFLLKPKVWNEIASPNIMKKPYVLLYLMEENSDSLKIAQILSKYMNIKVINITLSIGKYACVDKNIMTAGPSDFLSLIKNASYVITNSFHATAFSLIFKKPFVTLTHSKWNSRIQSLLNTFEVSTQMLTKLPSDNPEFLEKMFHYDEDKVNDLIEKESNISLNFLRNALK